MSDETTERLRAMFPRASEDFFKLNALLRTKRVEQVARATLVGAPSREAKSDARIGLRYVLYRVQLLDPDNADGATKTLTDCLCQIGLLPGDAANQITVKVDQEKVNHYAEERTELTIEYP